MNEIDKIVSKLNSKYKSNDRLIFIKRSYRIGIGKILEVTLKSNDFELQSSILKEAKPYCVWFFVNS